MCVGVCVWVGEGVGVGVCFEETMKEMCVGESVCERGRDGSRWRERKKERREKKRARTIERV